MGKMKVFTCLLPILAATTVQAQSVPLANADSLFMHVFSIQFGMDLDMYFTNGRAGSFTAKEPWNGGMIDSDYTTVSSENHFYTIHTELADVEDSITFYLDTVAECLRNLRIFNQNWSNMNGGPGPGRGTITLSVLPYSIDSSQHLHAEWSCHDCWQSLLSEGISINYSDTWDDNGVWYTGYPMGFDSGSVAFVKVDAGLNPSVLALSWKRQLTSRLQVDYDYPSKLLHVQLGAQDCMKTLTIFDLLGRKLYVKNILPNETEYTINIGNYSRGCYILCIGAETCRFIVP